MVAPHDLRTPILQQRFVEAENTGSVDIPAFGCVEITTASTSEPGRTVLSVSRPSALGGEYAFAGPIGIAVGKSGQVTLDCPTYALFDSSDTSPANGDTYGPKANQFTLKRGNAGYFTLAVSEGDVVLICGPESSGTSWIADADDNQPAGETAHTIGAGELLDFEGSFHGGGFRSRNLAGTIVSNDQNIPPDLLSDQTPLGVTTRTVTIGGRKTVQHSIDDEVAVCIKILANGGSITGDTTILFDDHGSNNTVGIDAGAGIELDGGSNSGVLKISVSGSLFTFATDAGTNVVVDRGETITLKGEGDIETEGDGSGNTCTIRNTDEQLAKLTNNLMPGGSATATLFAWNAATLTYDATGAGITAYDFSASHCALSTETVIVRKHPISKRHEVIGGGSLIRDGKAVGTITAGSSGTVKLWTKNLETLISVTAYLDWMETTADDIPDGTEVEIVWIMQPFPNAGEWKIRWAACPAEVDSLTQLTQEYALMVG